MRRGRRGDLIFNWSSGLTPDRLPYQGRAIVWALAALSDHSRRIYVTVAGSARTAIRSAMAKLREVALCYPRGLSVLGRHWSIVLNEV